ncbi:hypothetical protein RchiOBHm_Chr5g0007901 [Rosa chinensis]|uniref:Uncharacterized protein n=1 Tax=Rosa chinensis TaxID=74649 RepID=A0A2P6Q3Y4_ROSCH|nr:hypothetical protein RchiOBHm_Chr5g0007901 [Rosa chinensis]
MNSIKKKRKKKLQLVSFWQTSVGYVLIDSALIVSRREDAKSAAVLSQSDTTVSVAYQN